MYIYNGKYHLFNNINKNLYINYYKIKGCVRIKASTPKMPLILS